MLSSTQLQELYDSLWDSYGVLRDPESVAKYEDRGFIKDYASKAPNSRSGALKSAIEDLTEKPKGGVAHYRVVDTDLKVVPTCNTACLADLMNYEDNWMDDGYGSPRYVVYWLKDNAGNRKEFLDYIITESPLSPYLIRNHNNNPYYAEDVVVLSAELPHPLMALILSVLRWGLENEAWVNRWAVSVRGGMDKDLAFVMMSWTTEVDGGAISVRGGAGNSYHSPLQYTSGQYIVSVFSGVKKPHEVLKDYSYTEFKDYKLYAKSGIDYNFMSKDLAAIESTEVVVPEVRDLMGAVVTKEYKSVGKSIKDLNLMWSAMKDKYNSWGA